MFLGSERPAQSSRGSAPRDTEQWCFSKNAPKTPRSPAHPSLLVPVHPQQLQLVPAQVGSSSKRQREKDGSPRLTSQACHPAHSLPGPKVAHLRKSATGNGNSPSSGQREEPSPCCLYDSDKTLPQFLPCVRNLRWNQGCFVLYSYYFLFLFCFVFPGVVGKGVVLAFSFPNQMLSPGHRAGSLTGRKEA